MTTQITPQEAVRVLQGAMAKISIVNAMDYEYQRWAQEALEATAFIAEPESNWEKAVIHECMMAECGFTASDPRKTLHDLISWHVKTDRFMGELSAHEAEPKHHLTDEAAFRIAQRVNYEYEQPNKFEPEICMSAGLLVKFFEMATAEFSPTQPSPSSLLDKQVGLLDKAHGNAVLGREKILALARERFGWASGLCGFDDAVIDFANTLLQSPASDAQMISNFYQPNVMQLSRAINKYDKSANEGRPEIGMKNAFLLLLADAIASQSAQEESKE